MKKPANFNFYLLAALLLMFSLTIHAQIDYTSRIVNPSFELNNNGEPHSSGVLRVIEPYGWKFNHVFAINTGSEPGVVYLGNNSQGLNNDTQNRDGNWNYWFSGNNVIPEFVEFYQEVGLDEDFFPAGTYKVSCRMTIITAKITTQRLFANNVVQYFGKEEDYDVNISNEETFSFAGHSVDEANPGTFKDMEVTINLDGNTPLTIGVRTGSVMKDGTIAGAANPVFGWFKLDHFRIIKLADTDVDATLSDLKVNGITVAGFDPITETYSVEVPAGSTPEITATASKAEANVHIEGNTVVVTAPDNITTKTYTINFIYSYTSAWGANGLTGEESEPYNFGWRTYMGSTDVGSVPYTVAGTGYMRYMDNYSTYGSGRRLLFLRWDTQANYGSLDGTAIHSYPMTLEAGKNYKVSFDYAGQNSGEISILASINTERDNSGTSFVSDEFACTYREWISAELTFTAPVAGEYYFTVARASGAEIIFSLSNLLTIEWDGTVSSVNDADISGLKVYLNADQQLVVLSKEFAINSPFTVYNLAGQVLINGRTSGDYTLMPNTLNAGIYILKVNNEAQKFVIP